MKAKWRKGAAITLSAVMTLGMLAVPAMASAKDAVLNKPYVSLGADLDGNQRATVLELLGVTEEELQ